MKNTENIDLKIKEMLACFEQRNVHFQLISFLNQKADRQDRKNLRKLLIDQIKNHKDFKKYKEDFNWNNLLKIGTKANCPFVSISISHCKHMGAFLFTFDKNVSIGFDIEERNRITDKLVNRISSKEEIQQSPTSFLLWVAKEASFKCLNHKTQNLLSDCIISHWRKRKICIFLNVVRKKLMKEL